MQFVLSPTKKFVRKTRWRTDKCHKRIDFALRKTGTHLQLLQQANASFGLISFSTFESKGFLDPGRVLNNFLSSNCSIDDLFDHKIAYYTLQKLWWKNVKSLSSIITHNEKGFFVVWSTTFVLLQSSFGDYLSFCRVHIDKQWIQSKTDYTDLYCEELFTFDSLMMAKYVRDNMCHIDMNNDIHICSFNWSWSRRIELERDAQLSIPWHLIGICCEASNSIFDFYLPCLSFGWDIVFDSRINAWADVPRWRPFWHLWLWCTPFRLYPQ